MRRSKLQLLAAGVSMMAVVASVPALAQTSSAERLVTPLKQGQRGYLLTATDANYSITASDIVVNPDLLEVVAEDRVETTGTDAFAFAILPIGYEQTLVTAEPATIGFTNAGSVRIGADASAAASGGFPFGPSSIAIAEVGVGFGQSAQGTTASVTLANQAGADFTVFADAAAGSPNDPYASAQIGIGIDQQATATDGDAAAAIDNDGLIRIAADADARGYTTSGTAIANVEEGISQQVSAANGSATATIDNGGSIDILATGYALVGVPIDVQARIGSGIRQEAEGEESTTVLNNGGSIRIAADATAYGFGDDHGSALVDQGIGQVAASGSITNLGTLSIEAIAIASADTMFADAAITNGIAQTMRNGGGDAGASLANSGTIDILADATSVSFLMGEANAEIGFGIVQSVESGVGAATISLVNGTQDAAIRIEASAQTVDERNVNDVTAKAGIQSGIDQQASGLTGADVSLGNAGSIAIGADAQAGGQYSGAADAQAFVGQGVLQAATAFGEESEASVDLANLGSLAIDVDANATAGEGDASALAIIGTIQSSPVVPLPIPFGADNRVLADTLTPGMGIHQQVIGFAAATASIGNSGTVTLNANAEALANEDALAEAAIGTGIRQAATAIGDGGDALVEFANDGDVALAATSTARGGDGAEATSILALGIDQEATASVGGTVTAAVDNQAGLELLASATALAGNDLAAATAVLGVGIGQTAEAEAGGSVRINNSGDTRIEAEANAVADNAADFGADALATALVGGVVQTIDASMSGASNGVTENGGFEISFFDVATGSVLAELVNSGTLTIGAAIDVESDMTALGVAGTEGVIQTAGGAEALARIDNEADLAITALADVSARSGASADAFVKGIAQAAIATGSEFILTTLPDGSRTQTRRAGGTGEAAAELTNSGSILIAAEANVASIGGTVADTNIAWARVEVNAVGQSALGETAAATFDNSGSIEIAGTATANGEDSALTGIQFLGIGQGVTAYGESTEVSFAPDGTPIGGEQFVGLIGEATATMNNSGSIDVTMVADGEALGDEGYAGAGLTGWALFQVVGGGDAVAQIENSGDIDVTTLIDADAASGFGGMFVVGASQAAGGEESATVVFDNSGSLTVESSATIDASIYGEATGLIYGIVQTAESNGAAAAAVDNSGSISVTGNLFASGGEITRADVLVTGVQQLSGISLETDLAFDNGGGLTVDARAEADAGAGVAIASAVAVGLDASGAQLSVDIRNDGEWTVAAESVAASSDVEVVQSSALALGMHVLASGTLAGTIDTSGDLTVSARAIGDGEAELGPLAMATGIYVGAPAGTFQITNSGNIDVRASSSANGDVSAYGVLVQSESDGGAVSIVNDGGSILAAISLDDGDSWRRGVAIDVTEALQQAEIDLLGDGSIYGNLAIKAGDLITVDDGETSLDGIINPSGERVGTLAIGPDGTLFLRNPMSGDFADGPAQAYVDLFSMAPGSTLALEISRDVEPEPGTYPQIFAAEAQVDGTLEIRTVSGGLWEDEYRLENVIDADLLEGTFETVELAGTGVLLSATAEYDTQENVDVVIGRTAFGALGSETANQSAVGAGIEAVYDADLEGPFADLLAEFFTLDGEAYYDALDQLSGAQYAGFLRRLGNSSAQLNSAIASHLDCSVRRAGIEACAAPDRGLSLWALGGVESARVRPDGNAPGDDGDGRYALIGADHAFGNVAIGVFGGHRSLDSAFTSYGGKIDASGYQIGVHAAYDTGAFYLRGLASQTSLDGDSRRLIDIGTIDGLIDGSPDTKVMSLHAEGGVRVPLGSSWATLYAALDSTRVRLSGFTETGVDGANLEVPSQTRSASTLIGGVKWAAAWGGIVPEAKIAYRYRFGGDDGFRARFADAPAGSDFEVDGPQSDKGSILAGLGIGGVLSDRLSGRINYLGSFGGDDRDHSISGSLTIRLGGSR